MLHHICLHYVYHVSHLYHIFIRADTDIVKTRWPSASSSCMNWSTERQLWRPPQLIVNCVNCVNVVEPKIVKIKTKKGKNVEMLKSAAPSQVQPSQCPSERSKALESNSSLDVFQTNHQGSVAWIDRWVPIRIIRQNYVRFGDRIENAVRAAQLSKISRQLWRCISMESIALDKSFIA